MSNDKKKVVKGREGRPLQFSQDNDKTSSNAKKVQQIVNRIRKTVPEKK